MLASTRCTTVSVVHLPGSSVSPIVPALDMSRAKRKPKHTSWYWRSWARTGAPARHPLSTVRPFVWRSVSLNFPPWRSGLMPRGHAQGLHHRPSPSSFVNTPSSDCPSSLRSCSPAAHTFVCYAELLMQVQISLSDYVLQSCCTLICVLC